MSDQTTRGNVREMSSFKNGKESTHNLINERGPQHRKGRPVQRSGPVTWVTAQSGGGGSRTSAKGLAFLIGGVRMCDYVSCRKMDCVIIIIVRV